MRINILTSTAFKTSSNRAASVDPVGHDIRRSSATVPDRNEIGVIPASYGTG